jgi:uncharacterized RDD family membrane protein YckC
LSVNLPEPDWDQLSIDTPELVAIDLPLAGIGSRFVALLVDYLIWLIGFGAAIALFLLIDPSFSKFSKLGEKWVTALFIFIPFLLYWGYFTLFEAYWSGRTPGKWVAKIRVIQVSGRGIGLFESMTRNLLRAVDQFPFVYAVGVVFVFFTRQHQRLGDMAAGTLVVHERERLVQSSSESSGRTFTAGLFDAPISAEKTRIELGSGVQRLGPEDLEVLEGFFARRLDFSLTTRAALAERIAKAIQLKAGLEVPAGVSVETFLEEVALQLRDLSRFGARK